MTAFQTQTDIGSRALQHIGQRKLDPVLGFNESNKAAREVSFAYDKLRRAELRRNVWSFAVRSAMLRAIDVNTLILAPALWVSTATYFDGSIVQDSAGNNWISRVPNNTGNQPNAVPPSTLWEPYFGPLTVMLYDSSQQYFAGEIVYTWSGAGTYNVYVSLVGMNAVHPALPNQWSTSTTYFQNQVVQQFPAWASGTTYSQGQGVLYTDGNVYASLTNGNVGNTPPSSATNWALMPTLTLTSLSAPAQVPAISPPMTSPIIEWLQATTYSTGSFVMFAGSTYLSLVNSNTGNFPNAAGSTSWVIVSNGTLYMSLIDLNVGNSPANAPALWSSLTTYSTGQQVGGSDGVIYSSVGSGNLNHNPVGDNGVHWTNTNVLNPWTTVFTQGGGNDMWLQIGGASFPNGVGLSRVQIIYPIGAGPVSQSQTKNVYRLPSGFLRDAPQDPKAGAVSLFGVPGNLEYRDWEYRGNYIVTIESSPIPYWFVADIADVTQMDDLFCECLAAKLGMEVCEPLTQSTAKIQVCAAAYKKAETDAILINGIQQGPIEPPLDDLIACRF